MLSAVLSTPRILDPEKSVAEGSAVCRLKCGTECLEQEVSLNGIRLHHPQTIPPSPPPPPPQSVEKLPLVLKRLDCCCRGLPVEFNKHTHLLEYFYLKFNLLV